MKKEYVKLARLQDIVGVGITVEAQARWINNVVLSVGENGYGLDIVDEDCNYATKMLADSDVEACDDITVYTYMGGEYEHERFYCLDAQVVRELATGEYYALNTDELYDF